MAEKTPVMRLSELITKLHETCKFELIHSEPMKPWFEYEAIACNKRATGAAMSKKKAKQEAAKHLLNMIGGFTRQKSKLDCVDSPREMDCVTVRTESQAQKNMLMTTNIYMPQKPGETGCVTSIAEVGRREPIVSMSTTFINSVGSLQELCAQSDYPMPSYKLLDSRGPPHCGIFTISCSVANCSELGTGRTKKEAKHAAAQNVFQALTNQDESDNLVPKAPPRDEIFEETTRKAIELLATKRKSIEPNKNKLNIADLHMIFHNDLYPKSLTLETIKIKPSSWFLEHVNPGGLFERIVSELSFTFEMGTFKVEHCDPNGGQCYYTWLTVRSNPPWSFFGQGVSTATAKQKAFIEALVFFATMAL